jgi:citrate lyase beta subunit
MPDRIHPNDALFAGEKRYPIINACEHFAGSEKLITKAFEQQDKMGGVFDITMDCEDGAREGQEKQHAEMVVAMAKSEDASRARNEFGFLRMWSIYPTQIQSIVDAMKPNWDEVTTGVNILVAAQDASWGPIQYEGELHDRATYRYFWELVQKAGITGTPLPDEAKSRWFTAG